MDEEQPGNDGKELGAEFYKIRAKIVLRENLQYMAVSESLKWTPHPSISRCDG